MDTAAAFSDVVYNDALAEKTHTDQCASSHNEWGEKLGYFYAGCSGDEKS